MAPVRMVKDDFNGVTEQLLTGPHPRHGRLVSLEVPTLRKRARRTAVRWHGGRLTVGLEIVSVTFVARNRRLIHWHAARPVRPSNPSPRGCPGSAAPWDQDQPVRLSRSTRWSAPLSKCFRVGGRFDALRIVLSRPGTRHSTMDPVGRAAIPSIDQAREAAARCSRSSASSRCSSDSSC